MHINEIKLNEASEADLIYLSTIVDAIGWFTFRTQTRKHKKVLRDGSTIDVKREYKTPILTITHTDPGLFSWLKSIGIESPVSKGNKRRVGFVYKPTYSIRLYPNDLRILLTRIHPKLKKRRRAIVGEVLWLLEFEKDAERDEKINKLVNELETLNDKIIKPDWPEATRWDEENWDESC